MRVLLWLLGLVMGVNLGFAIGAWVLYEPPASLVGSAKYALSRSSGPVPPHEVDGTQKIFRIECISESVKDCPPATSIPEPGTLGLIGIGLVGFWLRRLH